MSLRVRLFILLAGLLALLMGAQWWLIQALSRDLGAEVSAVAFSIGQELVEVLQGSTTNSGSTGEAESETADVDVRVIQIDRQDEDRTLQRVIRVVRSKEAGPLTPEEIELLANQGISVELESETISGPLPPTAKSPPAPIPPGKEAFFLEVEHGDATGDDALILKGPREIREIPIPRRRVGVQLERFRSRLLAGSLALLALGLALAAMVAHRVSRPLRTLAAAAQRVGKGELGVHVPEDAGGEVGATLRAFNLMSSHLARLEQATRRLREAQHLTELGEVSQGFAHSLRNPLNALGLSVDMLAEEDGKEEQRMLLASTARQQIRRVDAALRSFLSLASSGGEPEELDVETLLQDVALEAIQDCQGNREEGDPPSRLEILPAHDLPALQAVAPELRAVLQALVINAMEASPAGGLVTLSVQGVAKNRIRVSIQDEGPGLPPSVREKLFTPHVTTKAHGSGMGLFLAHRIASRRYEGSLVLEDLSREDETRTGVRAILELGHRIPSEAQATMEHSTDG